MGSIQRRIDQAFQGVGPLPQEQPVSPLAPETSPKPPLKPQGDQIQVSPNSQGSSIAQLELDQPTTPQTHKVKKGESLSLIAKQYFGNPNYYMEIYNLNRDIMKHPNHVSENMELKLPQHLFPQQEGQAPEVSPGQSLKEMRNENPLSYVTLAGPEETPSVMDTLPNIQGTPFAEKHHPTDATTVAKSPLSLIDNEILTGTFEFAKDSLESLTGLDLFVDDKPTVEAKTVQHVDAIKVDKGFNLHPKLTLSNLPSQTDDWALKVAEVLKEHQASIKLPDGKGGSFQADAAFMENLANQVKDGNYEDVKNFFREEKGIAFINTLWAIDDVVTNLKADPYYQDIKAYPKTIDLAEVSKDFNLANDKLNYLARTKAHKHKQVPVILEMDPAQLNASTQGNKSAADILQDLSTSFNGKGRLTDAKGFENKVYALLNDTGARRTLIEHFKLNSDDNLSALIPAITAEGGMAESQQDYNSYFAVGSVMVNRALGRNIKKAAQNLAKGVALDKIRPVSMDSIIREKGQFEIVWRKLPGKSQTIYEFNKSLNQAFLSDRLKEGGNSSDSFTIAYEVSRDLIAGMNRLKADVNGVESKGTGRSTAELFYFNQSRSRDHSRYTDSAVELIDKNNTHVFFKEWGDIPYF